MKSNKAFLRMNVAQGSPEWLEMRRGYVTASAIPAIFGLCPYQTELQVWEEKYSGKVVRPRAPDYILNLGHESEAMGRTYVSEKLGMSLDPAVVVSTRLPSLLASLDGFNEDAKTLLEAKYRGREIVSGVLNGEVAVNDFYQMQAQILATGADKCIYFVRDPDGRAATLDVLPDNLVIDQIAEKIESFMKSLKSGEPPEPSARDYIEVDDPDFEKLKELKLAVDSAAEQHKAEVKKYEVLKDHIDKKYSKETRVRGSGMMFWRTLVKRPIPYAEIPAVKALDLEKYRPEPRSQITFKIVKGKS